MTEEVKTTQFQKKDNNSNTNTGLATQTKQTVQSTKSTGMNGLFQEVEQSLSCLFGSDKIITGYLKTTNGAKFLQKQMNVCSFLYKSLMLNTEFNKKTQRTDTYKDIIFGDIELKTTFMNKMFKYLQQTDGDLSYCYLFLRGNKNSKSGFSLDFNIQYQAEQQYLTQLGYTHITTEIIDSTNKDKFNSKFVDGVKVLEVSQSTTNFYEEVKYKDLLNLHNNNEMKEMVNKKLADIVFVFSAYLDEKKFNNLLKNGVPYNNARMMSIVYIEVNKDRLIASLKASLKDKKAFEFNGSSIKLASGLKGIIDILMVHRAYNYIVNNSLDDDWLEQQPNNEEKQEEQEIKEVNSVDLADRDI